MRGFEIRSKTKEGNEALSKDWKSNKKMFKIIRVEEEPFLIMRFLFRKIVINHFRLLPESELTRNVSNALIDLGAKPGKDFEVTIIQ